FPEAMERGGFDVIVGNPPWGGDIDADINYFHAKYPASTQEHTDSFKLFIERALSLARPGGLISMIVPNTLLRQRRMMDVRKLLLENRLRLLVDLGENVFPDVVAPSCIFVVEKGASPSNISILDVSHLQTNEEKAESLKVPLKPLIVKQSRFLSNADLEFAVPMTWESAKIIPLGQCDFLICEDAGINYQRVGVGMREKGRSDLGKRLLYEGAMGNPEDKMYWKGTDINRYWIAESTRRFCRTNYKQFIRDNEVVRLNVEVYSTVPKILIRQTADRVIATIDYRGVWFGRSILSMLSSPGTPYRLEYFLALLNSRLFVKLYQDIVREKGRVFAQVKLSKLKQLPIRLIDFSDPADAARHDKMVAMVEEMLRLQKEREEAEALKDDRRHELARRIERLDKEIDALVYELYGLTEEEIAVVEGSKG
ncbi:MAG: Eco57I restriction-modification methylase domain-containing protein, partial [Anaerolineae bacterium]